MYLMIRVMVVSALAFAIGQAFGTPAARAQGLARGSLGGYGGEMSSLDSGMGMSGPVIPYAGKFGGFMPYRMGGSGSGTLSFQSRGIGAMGSVRSSFSLSPMSGMSSMGGGMSQGSGVRASSFFGSPGAMGSAGGVGRMPGGSGSSMGVMPPSFGYPFRQPPSLLAPTVTGTGMSM
jgi:hypothetical protein